MHAARSLLGSRSLEERLAAAEVLAATREAHASALLPVLLEERDNDRWEDYRPEGEWPRPLRMLPHLGDAALPAVPRLLAALQYGERDDALEAIVALGPAAHDVARPVLAAIAANDATAERGDRLLRDAVRAALARVDGFTARGA